MQHHCIVTQKKAVKELQKGRPADIPEKQFEMIRRKAAVSWPNDFEMRAHEEETQFKAWRKLRNSEQTDLHMQGEVDKDSNANISAEMLHIEKTKLRLSIIPRFRFGNAMSNPSSKSMKLINIGNGRAKIKGIKVVSGDNDIIANIPNLPLSVEKDGEFSILLSPKNQVNMNLVSFQCQLLYADELDNKYQMEVFNNSDHMRIEDPILLS